MSFLTLALAQLWHVFNMRDRDSGLLSNDVIRNPWIAAALGLCIALLAGAIYIPVFAQLLSITPPGAAAWATIVGFSALPLAARPLTLVFGPDRVRQGSRASLRTS